MADEPQRQKSRRKLAARIAAAFRIHRQPTLLERRRIDPLNDDNREDNSSSNNSNQQRRASVMTTVAQPQRRLPRGWWPDQGKREGLKLKAMYDLQNETFVVTEDHIEYIFQEKQGNDSDTQYKINLILPSEITGRQGKQNNQCSNECSICMLEYDIGDVAVYSKHCSHVFHQECILNWFSHSNVKSGESNKSCPSCRCTFWEDDFDKQKQKDEVGGGSLRENRSRSDTEDTAALSVNVEYSRSMGEIIHEQNALLPVAED